jgi:PAS domain S-box-containing protein
MSVGPGELDQASKARLFEALLRSADRAQLGISITHAAAHGPETVLMNEGACLIIGCSLDEVGLKPLWDSIAPEELPRLKDFHERRRRGEKLPSSFETVVLNKSGERVPIEVIQSLTELDGKPVTISLFRDISDRKRASTALMESEARFRSLIEGAPDGVAILRGPRILFLNPTAARLLGLESPEQANGRSILEFLHPEDAERAAVRIRRLLESGQRHGEPAEYRSRAIDGSERTVEIASIPIEYEGAPAVLAFARDITERKAIQAKLVEADRLAALGVLSAGVAHEINNPLAYVLLNLEYLGRELPKLGSHGEALEDLMLRVRDACHGAERVATIVRDLRTFARGDEGARQIVDLRDVIEAALSIVRNELDQKARLVREYSDVGAVDGNPNRLEQVFLNLLLNAAQAFATADPERNEIRVRLRSERGHVSVDISDNGGGIAPHLTGRIFDPFFTTKPVGVGTGLGLPICRSIVRAHGGDVAVNSVPGKGATFTVSLPASRHSADSEPVRRPSEPGMKMRGRVLIVDDEAAVAKTLSMLLQNEHDLSLAASGEDALRLLRATSATGGFDAIICDLMMPGMSGIELYELIKSEYPGVEQRVIFMTGGVSMLRATEFLAAVKNPTFEKPFDMNELRKTLHALVETARGASTS